MTTVYPYTFGMHYLNRRLVGTKNMQFRLKEKCGKFITGSYTWWFKIVRMKDVTFTVTVSALREFFSLLGYPNHIVSGNGP